MGPTWGRQDPGGPHVGPIIFAIREWSEIPAERLRPLVVSIARYRAGITRVCGGDTKYYINHA